MNNKSYCVLAYNHLSIDPTGQVRPCCNYNYHHAEYPSQDWRFGNVTSGKTISELVSSPAHNSLRDDIETNRRHKFCDRCWVVEDGGGHSYRNDWNQRFGITDNTIKHEVKIEYLELTLGNKCNIQCRMCNPWSSNLWAEDIKKHPELNYWESDVDHVNFEYYNTPEFDAIFNEIIPTIKHINLLGGEPLFNSKYYEILQKVIDSGRAHEVSIQFNTNLLALQDKSFDLWKEFKYVNANISCDGVGVVNEYVRYPGKWSKFIRNLEKITDWQTQLGGPDKLFLQIHATMSSLTWLNLGELFKWCHTLPHALKTPFLIQVNQPSYMDCIHMPEPIKQLGYERICESLAGLEPWESKNIFSLVDHVINTTGDPAKWETMIIETNKLDRVRSSNIIDIIPEYKDFWTNDI